MIKTYLAYRLPGQQEVHIYAGNGMTISSLDECSEKGFLFHQFSGNNHLFIDQLRSITERQFETYYGTGKAPAATTSEYLTQFEQLKAKLDDGTYKKVILSRIKWVPTDKSPMTIFQTLNKTYNNTFNYLLSHPELGTWIGATPEVLLTISKDLLNTMSLAGTKSPDESWGKKELEEQELVTNSILETLEDQHCKNITANGPSTIKAGEVEHLKTEITAEISKANNWKKIVSALHPTPAVCGIPKETARDFILQLEPHDRKFYTGYLGIITPTEKQFFVNLRCMECYSGKSKLYLGGGITSSSVGEKEWQETERKARTLEAVIQKPATK